MTASAAAAPAGLVLALAAQLNVRSVFFCLLREHGDLDLAATFPDLGVPLVRSPLEDILAHLAGEGGSEHGLMVVCDVGNDTDAAWSNSHFRRQFTWLLPSGASGASASAAMNLPFSPTILRLDSNVLLHSPAVGGVTTTVREVYSVKTTAAVVGGFGSYSYRSGMLTVSQPSTWRRRTDLRGVTVVNSVVGYNPFVYRADTQDPTGLMIDVLTSITERVNLTVRTTNPKDFGFGSIG